MQRFLLQASRAVQDESSHAIAELLAVSYNTEHASLGRLDVGHQMELLCAQAGISTSWMNVFALHLRCFDSVQSRRYVSAYDHQSELLQHFFEVFEHTSTNWLVPALHRIVCDMRFIAGEADQERRQRGGAKDEKVREAERALKKAFTVCITDRAPMEVSKKWGCVQLNVIGCTPVLASLHQPPSVLGCTQALAPVRQYDWQHTGPPIVLVGRMIGRAGCF